MARFAPQSDAGVENLAVGGIIDKVHRAKRKVADRRKRKARRGSIGFGSVAFLPGIAEQLDLSGGDMGVEPIVAFGILPAEVAKEAAFVGTEGLSPHFACTNGSVDAAVVALMDGADRDLPRSDFNVLVALDAFNRDLTRQHANTQVGPSGDFDPDLDAVIAMRGMRTLDREFAAIRRGRKMKGDVARGVVIAGGAGDMNRVLVGADDFESRRL